MNVAAFINRTAAQQLRRMRESWDDELLAALATPATPTQATPRATPPTITTMPANAQTVAYPWDDITALDDEPGTAWHELAGLAIGAACFIGLVAALSFSLGLLAGMRAC